MTTSRRVQTLSWDRVDGLMSAARIERAEYLGTRIAAACSALRRPLMRSTTMVGIVNQETSAHCLRRAQAVLSPEEFETHAQRIALLRSATDADFGTDCRKAWMAGLRRSCRVAIEAMKKQMRAASEHLAARGGMARFL